MEDNEIEEMIEKLIRQFCLTGSEKLLIQIHCLNVVLRAADD